MTTMTTKRVRFSDVGRALKTWEADIPFDPERGLDQVAMIASIKRQKALGSRGIDLEDDGGIYVGGLRKVGSWEVLS